MRRVEEPTEVEVRFAKDGTPHLSSFSWMRRRLVVSATGRNWADESGRHVLVTSVGEGVFELLLRRADLSWYVVGAPEGRLRLIA